MQLKIEKEKVLKHIQDLLKVTQDKLRKNPKKVKLIGTSIYRFGQFQDLRRHNYTVSHHYDLLYRI